MEDEKKPPQGRLGWFDGLLLKIAVAKHAAREGYSSNLVSLARELKEAFLVTREP